MTRVFYLNFAGLIGNDSVEGMFLEKKHKAGLTASCMGFRVYSVQICGDTIAAGFHVADLTTGNEVLLRALRHL